METTKLSSKGQVVLPKSVRDAHKWQPGAEFAVEELRWSAAATLETFQACQV